MKLGMVVGILLILGALVAGVVVIPEQVTGYAEDGDHIARDLAEVDAILAETETAPDARKEELARRADTLLDVVRDAKDFRRERLQGIAIVGGGGLVAIGLGIWLIRRSRRSRAATAHAV